MLQVTSVQQDRAWRIWENVKSFFSLSPPKSDFGKQEIVHKFYCKLLLIGKEGSVHIIPLSHLARWRRSGVTAVMVWMSSLAIKEDAVDACCPYRSSKRENWPPQFPTASTTYTQKTKQRNMHLSRLQLTEKPHQWIHHHWQNLFLNSVRRHEQTSLIRVVASALRLNNMWPAWLCLSLASSSRSCRHDWSLLVISDFGLWTCWKKAKHSI